MMMLASLTRVNTATLIIILFIVLSPILFHKNTPYNKIIIRGMTYIVNCALGGSVRAQAYRAALHTYLFIFL